MLTSIQQTHACAPETHALMYGETTCINPSTSPVHRRRAQKPTRRQHQTKQPPPAAASQCGPLLSSSCSVVVPLLLLPMQLHTAVTTICQSTQRYCAAAANADASLSLWCLDMLEVWQLPAADLLQHCLGWALDHMSISWDDWLAGVMDLAGVHMMQAALSRHLLQETLLVPLQPQHTSTTYSTARLKGAAVANSQLVASACHVQNGCAGQGPMNVVVEQARAATDGCPATTTWQLLATPVHVSA